jgi:pimeloyl-ACP methyl ester carboxylesterase
LESLPDAPQSDAEALAHIGKLVACARRFETRTAAGSMVWHGWGKGRPLVFLHGGSGSWTHWIRNIPYFMHDRHVLAGDLPGLGDSAEPQAPHSAQSLAGIVASGLEQLLPPATAVDLVGFSFGGIISGHMAAMSGAPVRKLVIVGSPPFGLGSTGPANQVVAVDPGLDFEQARALHRRNLERLMFADARRVDALALRVHHDNLRRARLRSRKIARTPTLAQALRRGCCELHGIWGREDVTIHPDLESIRELFTARCDAGFDLLPGVGHWAPYEAAGEFNRLLERRLDGN